MTQSPSLQSGPDSTSIALNDMPVVVENVTFRYPGSTDARPVLDNVSLTVQPRDYVGIIGPNGGGKTTLLKIMLGLIKPHTGSVRIFGMPPHRARLHIGYVPQNARLDVAVPANVLDVVLMGRLGRSKWGFRYNSRDKHRAYDALEQVGVADLAKRPVTALSGGQRQRVLIARALVSQARILMLDEPTAGVDEMAEQGLYDLLKRLNRDVPIVLVSHDIAFVTVHMKHVACLNKNVVMHNAAEISRDVITKMYTPPPGESFVEGPHAVELRRIDHDHHECVDGHVHGPDCGHDHEHGEKPGGASSS